FTDRLFLYTLFSISTGEVEYIKFSQTLNKRLIAEDIDTTKDVIDDSLKKLSNHIIKISIKDSKAYISVINQSVNDFMKHNLIEAEKQKILLNASFIDQFYNLVSCFE